MQKNRYSSDFCIPASFVLFFSLFCVAVESWGDGDFVPCACSLSISEFSTGSLGHGLPVAVGKALKFKINKEINKVFGPDVAKALDHTSVSVRAPKDPSQKVSFMSLLENIEVDPAAPIAKVVVNARTGTIVIGGDVRVTPAAVSHGSLTVKVNEDTNTTPGQTLYDDAGNITTTTAANEEKDTEIEAGAETASAFVFDAGTSLADVVDAINAIGTTSADLVAILEALRAAGALRAQMIII